MESQGPSITDGARWIETLASESAQTIADTAGAETPVTDMSRIALTTQQASAGVMTEQELSQQELREEVQALKEENARLWQTCIESNLKHQRQLERQHGQRRRECNRRAARHEARAHAAPAPAPAPASAR